MINTDYATFLIKFNNTNTSLIISVAGNILIEALKSMVNYNDTISSILEYNRLENRFKKVNKDRVIACFNHKTEALYLLSKFGYISKKHPSYTV